MLVLEAKIIKNDDFSFLVPFFLYKNLSVRTSVHFPNFGHYMYFISKKQTLVFAFAKVGHFQASKKNSEGPGNA